MTVRRLTLKEVEEQYGGVLPPDAVFRPEHDDPPPPKKAKGGPPRRAERFAVLNAFADLSLAGLTGAEVKVWLILYRDTKAVTGTARTGQTDIARRAGLKPRTVRYALASLEEKGLVRVVRRGRLNGGPSVYRVLPIGTR